MDLDAQKRALRTQIRQRLVNRPQGDPQQRLLQWQKFRDARVVGLYKSLPSEARTDALAVQGKTICYPVITLESRALTFRTGAAFVKGPLGIEEPVGDDVPLARIDLLVIPALAVDTSGHRLGRGKGHYDATLAAFGGVKVALVFEAQVVENVPAAPHDVRMDAICTEARLVETT